MFGSIFVLSVYFPAASFLEMGSAFFLWFCFSDASPTIYSAKTTVKPSIRVSWGFTSEEEAYCGCQFTGQW